MTDTQDRPDPAEAGASAQEERFPRAAAARRALLEAAIPEAAFEGWNEAMLARAGDIAGLSEGEIELYCPGGVLDLLTAARDLVPGVRELAVEEVRAGLRPGTPDNLPLVGPTALPGLVLATGHFRHGVLQAPLAAEAVAHSVRTGALPAGVDAADPRRFTA